MTSPAQRLKPGRAAARGAGDGAELRAWLSVVRAYHLCDAVMAQRLGAIGVRTPEHEILANLRREPGITQQVLAQRCFSAKSHISALLTALEDKGWVRREPDPRDARAKRLFLQPAGEQVVQRSAAVQAQVVAEMAQALSPAATLQVTQAMQSLAERLQAMLAAEVQAGSSR